VSVCLQRNLHTSQLWVCVHCTDLDNSPKVTSSVGFCDSATYLLKKNRPLHCVLYFSQDEAFGDLFVSQTAICFVLAQKPFLYLTCLTLTDGLKPWKPQTFNPHRILTLFSISPALLLQLELRHMFRATWKCILCRFSNLQILKLNAFWSTVLFSVRQWLGIIVILLKCVYCEVGQYELFITYLKFIIEIICPMNIFCFCVYSFSNHCWVWSWSATVIWRCAHWVGRCWILSDTISSNKSHYYHIDSTEPGLKKYTLWTLPNSTLDWVLSEVTS
jgi:hypothetical protein